MNGNRYVLFVIVAIVIGGIFFVWQKTPKQAPIGPDAALPPIPPSTAPRATSSDSNPPQNITHYQFDKEDEILYTANGEIDTSNWYTYKDTAYGFEIEYPKGWTVEKRENKEDKTTFVSFRRGKADIVILTITPRYSLKDIVEQSKTNGEYTKLKMFIINGIPVVGIPQSNFQTDYSLHFEKAGFLYSISESFAGLPGDKTIIETIYNSFQFTNPQ
jgi:hypothetical protein